MERDSLAMRSRLAILPSISTISASMLATVLALAPGEAGVAELRDLLFLRVSSTSFSSFASSNSSRRRSIILWIVLKTGWSLVMTLFAAFTELVLFSVFTVRPKLSALLTAVSGISFSGRSSV